MNEMNEWNEWMKWMNEMNEWNEWMKWMNEMNEWNEWMEGRVSILSLRSFFVKNTKVLRSEHKAITSFLFTKVKE